MKIVEICEAIDQKEADELLKSLVTANDPVAKYFQQTRYNPIHTTIDSAQRAAERMWHKEKYDKEQRNRDVKADTTPASKFQFNPEKEPKAPTKKDRDPADWGDRFYGNQHTGALGRGLDLDIDMDQRGLKTIGKGINAVKKAFSPVSSIAKAFGAGMQKAPSRK
jgi:hypothetical protein